MPHGAAVSENYAFSVERNLFWHFWECALILRTPEAWKELFANVQGLHSPTRYRVGTYYITIADIRATGRSVRLRRQWTAFTTENIRLRQPELIMKKSALKDLIPHETKMKNVDRSRRCLKGSVF